MDKSILLLILAMCLVLGLMLYIYFRKEKTIKTAILLLSIMVLTAVFSLLLEETIKKISNQLSSSNQNTIENINEGTNQTDLTEREVLNGKGSHRVRDFFYFLSPMGRNFTKKIDKKYYPDWMLIAFGIFASLLLIGWSSGEWIPKLPKPFPLYVIMAILIVVNIYAIYIFAFLSSIMLSTILSGLPEKLKLCVSIFTCSFFVVLLPTIEIYSLFYENSHHDYDYMLKN